MKYCNKCGKEVFDEDVVCPACGCSLDGVASSSTVSSNTLYCSHCGKEVNPNAVVCTNCGCAVRNFQEKKVSSNQNNLYVIAKVFMIIATVLSAFCYLIPLAWTIPMTVSFCKKLNKNEKIGTGFKVCCLLFVNTIAGILMLCVNDNESNQ